MRRFALLLSAVLLIGCSGSKDTPRGKYPAATSKFHGRTAAEYAEKAKDLDYDICYDACAGLRELKAEGIPYLFDVIKYHADRGSPTGLIALTVGSLDGAIVDREDLALLLPYLSPKYADGDGETSARGVRMETLRVFRGAKAKARPYIPAIEKMLKEPALKQRMREYINTALGVIEGD